MMNPEAYNEFGKFISTINTLERKAQLQQELSVKLYIQFLSRNTYTSPETAYEFALEAEALAKVYVDTIFAEGTP